MRTPRIPCTPPDKVVDGGPHQAADGQMFNQQDLERPARRVDSRHFQPQRAADHRGIDHRQLLEPNPLVVPVDREVAGKRRPVAERHDARNGVGQSPEAVP